MYRHQLSQPFEPTDIFQQVRQTSSVCNLGQSLCYSNLKLEYNYLLPIKRYTSSSNHKLPFYLNLSKLTFVPLSQQLGQNPRVYEIFSAFQI